jgi:hypothetical protein
MSAKDVFDKRLLRHKEVNEWLATEAGQTFYEERRCAAARKAAVTKMLEHTDPQDLLDGMGICGEGWTGKKEESTLERAFLTVDKPHGAPRGTRGKRKSGAQRRKEKKNR